MQGETTAEVDAKLEAAIEEMVKAHKDELQTKDGSTSYSTRIDTTNDVQVGATSDTPPAVHKKYIIRLFKGCLYPRCGRKGNYCNRCKKLNRDLGEKIKRRWPMWFHNPIGLTLRATDWTGCTRGPNKAVARLDSQCDSSYCSSNALAS